jgi:hypothetical protein
MPFAPLALRSIERNGVGEFFRSIGNHLWRDKMIILRGLGPAGITASNKIENILDTTAKQSGPFMEEMLSQWKRIPESTRLQIGEAMAGFSDDATEAALRRSPALDAMFRLQERMGQEIGRLAEATRDPLGNPIMTFDPFTQAEHPFRMMGQRYFPLFTKHEKFHQIIDPMNTVEEFLVNQEMQRLGMPVLSLQDRLKAARTLFPDVTEESLEKLEAFSEPNLLRRRFSNAIALYVSGGHKGLQNLAGPFTAEQQRMLADIGQLTDPIRKALQPAVKNVGVLREHIKGVLTELSKGTKWKINPEYLTDHALNLFISNDASKRMAGFQLLKDRMFNDMRQARKFGSLEYSRSIPLPKDWYELDPLRAWIAYVPRAYRRVAEVKEFGNKNQLVKPGQTWEVPGTGNELYHALSGEADRKLFSYIFDRFMGLDAYNAGLRRSQDFVDKIFAFEVGTKLGTAQVSQLGQILNSVFETDLASTLRATADALGDWKGSLAEARRLGSVIDQMMGDVLLAGQPEPGAGSGRELARKFLDLTGFTKLDLGMRVVASRAGRYYGEKMLTRLMRNPADRLALHELRRFGFSQPELANMLTKLRTIRNPVSIHENFADELGKIARRATWDSNFRSTMMDLPLRWEDPVGRFLTLFRNFAFKQAIFMSKMMADKVKLGREAGWQHAVPLLATVAISPFLLGEGIGTLKAAVTGRLDERDPQWIARAARGEEDWRSWLDRYVENLAYMGSLGMFDSMVRSAWYGDRGLARFLTGPIVGDLLFTIGEPTAQIALAPFASGEEAEGKARAATKLLATGIARQVPVLGPQVQRAVRAALENVERTPGGQVFTGAGRRPRLLGEEEPGPFPGVPQVPSLNIILGLQPTMLEARERALDEISEAVHSGRTARIAGIVQKAREQGVYLRGEDIRRRVQEALRVLQEA